MTNETALLLDSDGHLLNHNVWSPTIAQQLAESLDIQLTSEHFLILNTVRDFHTNFGHPPTTRPLINYLVQTLPELALDNQKLQQLFNTGLVARHVNRLAGLPKPANCL